MSTLAATKQGRRPRRQFDDDFRAQAVRLVLDEGKPVGAAARDVDLTPSVLRRWVDQARPPAAYPSPPPARDGLSLSSQRTSASLAGGDSAGGGDQPRIGRFLSGTRSVPGCNAVVAKAPTGRSGSVNAPDHRPSLARRGAQRFDPLQHRRMRVVKKDMEGMRRQVAQAVG